MVRDMNSKVQREHEVVFSDQNSVSADQSGQVANFQPQFEQIDLSELSESVTLDIPETPNRERKEESILLKWLMSGHKLSQ